MGQEPVELRKKSLAIDIADRAGRLILSALFCNL
jgi:hypothetical protein